MSEPSTQDRPAARTRFRELVDRLIVPVADANDLAQETPRELITALAAEGVLGTVIPSQFQGSGLSQIEHGILCEEVGRGSASLLSLVTVHAMTAHAIVKWGSREQQEKWLPSMARGTTVGAFALTEPEIGCDASSVSTTARAVDDGYRIRGVKRWISFGQIADLYLVIGKLDGKATAFLVERERDGVGVEPLTNMLGLRSAMIAEVRFDDAFVGPDALLGRPGFGFSHVVGSSLDLGRYSVGCGCTGLIQACLDASVAYAGDRNQFGVPLSRHQLIQAMIADMTTDLQAARALCAHAGRLRDEGAPESIMESTIAKYFASRASVRAASDAVQIHGANGCGPDYPVQRYLRDAKIMEIVEGSNQMQQLMISRSGASYCSSQRRD